MDKEIQYKTKVEEAVNESLYEFERPTGGFERIFPRKETIEYYRQFIESPGEENEKLWEKIK